MKGSATPPAHRTRAASCWRAGGGIPSRKLLAVVIISLACAPAAGAFDTFWHSAATSAAAQQLGFSQDALNVVQFGNFAGPDFFGPLYDTVIGERVEKARVLEKVNEFKAFRQSNVAVKARKAAIFMHFDNLHGELDRNWKFDYLFVRLLGNTQKTLAALHGRGDLNDGTRKLVILLALGSSVHMVQDFYSHSDWIHHDFAKLDMSLVRLPWGKDRAPTWFEVRAKLGDPETWRLIKVESGVYPPKPGLSGSHTHLNHDNSQLAYKDEESSQVRSQVEFHGLGAVPAADAGSAAEHQLFAANTAAGASIEWIQKVMEDPGARSAIDFARGWDLKRSKAETPDRDRLQEWPEPLAGRTQFSRPLGGGAGIGALRPCHIAGGRRVMGERKGGGRGSPHWLRPQGHVGYGSCPSLSIRTFKFQALRRFSCAG